MHSSKRIITFCMPIPDKTCRFLIPCAAEGYENAGRRVSFLLFSGIAAAGMMLCPMIQPISSTAALREVYR
jgi:hypothetical protein